MECKKLSMRAHDGGDDDYDWQDEGQTDGAAMESLLQGVVVIVCVLIVCLVILKRDVISAYLGGSGDDADGRGGFAAIPTDADLEASTKPTPTRGALPGMPDISVKDFVTNALTPNGIPVFMIRKYINILKENYITDITAMKNLDTSDWRRMGTMGLPAPIQQTLRDEMEKML